MHWGRICAAAAILALTLLTFAACGPIEFKGTDLLLNRLDSGDLEKQMSGMMGEMGAKPSSDAKKSETKTIFEGGDAWLHYLYIACAGVALLGLLVKPKLFLPVGVLGLVLVAVFMFMFDGWFDKQMKKDGAGSGGPPGMSISMGGLDWKEGAWIALAGFAGLAAAGFQAKKGGGGSS